MTEYFRKVAAIALMGLMAGAVGACDSFLDVNEDPNAPETVRMELVLAGMIVHHTSDLAEYHIGSWTSQWMNQYAYNGDRYGYSQRHRYEMTAIDSDEVWTRLYPVVGRDAVNMIKETDQTGETTYRGIAKLLLAWKGMQLTDLYGPIPWSKAFNTEDRDPEYDTQQAVYADLHSLVEDAVTDLGTPPTDPAARRPGTNDLLFAGDMAKWVKLGRMLQARMHLRLAYAPGENTPQRAQAALTALSQGFTSNADNAQVTFPGGDGARQPLYGGGDQEGKYGDGDWDHNNRASHFFIELLKGRNDPRLPILFNPALRDGQFRGHVVGEPAVHDSTVSLISINVWRETNSYPWFLYEEGKFIEAEARLIVSGAAAADAPYRAGIRANMERRGVASAAIDAYLAALPPLSSVAKPLEAIITQKYIADFLLGEAYNDWRRTGYPVLPVVANQPYLPQIPQRFRTPAVEVTYNAQSVLDTAIPQGLDGMLTKVWWASGQRTVQ